MAEDIRLCSRCRSIDFKSLLYDRPGDIPEYALPHPDGVDGLWWTDEDQIPHGLLAAAVRRRSSCDFCAFISESACHGFKRDLDGDADSDTDSDTDTDENDSNAETTSGGCSPESTALSVSEVEINMSDTRMRFLGPSSDQEDIASDKESPPRAEFAMLDLSGRPFKLPLRYDGRSFRCILGQRDFGKLMRTFWEGKPVEVLSIRKLTIFYGRAWDPYDPRLQLCVDPSSNFPTKGTGREVADLVDLGLVKGWIETCRSRHGDACEMPAWLDKAEPAPGLRVIDVVGRRVMPAPPGCRYLALSYVWGESALAKMATALNSNIASLGEENGLACLTLPRTIRDALELTERLGERYLWVDSLCIVQDDMEDVQRQTTAMDSIFSGAALTIAAAAGNDADAGLPGLTPGSRHNTRQKIRVTTELSLLSTIEGELARSKWSRRGWTFQEQLLSRRMLYFTQNLVSWKCDHDIWSEETILEPEEPDGIFLDPADITERAFARTRNRFAVRRFDSYIRDYSARKLTYGSDILPAFQGATHRYEAVTGERLHWGLPCRIISIGNSLMWLARRTRGERQDLRKLRLDDGTTIHMLYPSWSWMGWNGKVHGPWDFSLGEPPGYVRPELDFYKLMSDGCVELLAPRERPIPAEDLRRLRPPLTRLWKGPTTIDGPVLTAPGDGGLVQEVVPAQPGAAGAYPCGRIPVYDTGRLVFWTSHAKIRTWSVAEPRIPLGLHLQLPGRISRSDDGGQWSNDILYEISAKTAMRLFGRSYGTRKRGDAAASRLLSYVVVGENFHLGEALQRRKENAAIMLARRRRGGNFAADDLSSDDDEPVSAFLDALIVEWVDEDKGIARRVGKALFSEPDWMSLDRDWRRVILQ